MESYELPDVLQIKIKVAILDVLQDKGADSASWLVAKELNSIPYDAEGYGGFNMLAVELDCLIKHLAYAVYNSLEVVRSSED